MQFRNLKDLVIKISSSLKLTDVSDIGNYPVYGAQGLVGFTDTYQTDTKSIALIKDGAGVGRVQIIPAYSSVLGTLQLLKPVGDTNIAYLYYLIKHLNLGQSFNGTTIPHIYFKDYGETVVRYRNYNEQLEISNVLIRLDDYVAAKEIQMNQFDELIKSRFNELFGDPLLNEKGFPVEKLSVSCPFNVYKGNVEITNGKVWLLNLDMIESNTGAVLSKQYVCLSEVGNSVIKFDKDCVLYSKLRPYLNKVVISDGSGYASSELVYMKTGKRIRKEFLANLLRSKSFVDYIDSKSGGAKMPRASMDFLRSFPLIVPPERLQEQFATFVNQIDKSKFVFWNK